MKLYPETGSLRKRFHDCMDAVDAWIGTMYRATTTEYANRKDLLTGAGSRKAGARWNAIGSFNAVYGCLEPETAMVEALANYRHYGIPVSEAMPLVFAAIALELEAVIDFTDRNVQATLGVSARKMRTTTWKQFQQRGEEAITQALGRIAFEEKLEGILVPSARVNGATNLIIFPSRRRRGSSWRISKASKLPRKNET